MIAASPGGLTTLIMTKSPPPLRTRRAVVLRSPVFIRGAFPVRLAPSQPVDHERMPNPTGARSPSGR